MKTKILEIRDTGTFIPVVAIDINPNPPYPANGSMTMEELQASLDANLAQLFYLRRCGYPCDGRPNIAIAHLDAGGQPFWNDPYGWGGRTYPVAHKYIIEHWGELRDGSVVDVAFILGETAAPKESERMLRGPEAA